MSWFMKTDVIQVDPASVDSDVIARAAAVVDGGGLVAFPTETVYGIACSASTESLRRLDHIKKRPPGKHYTLHIGSPATVRRYVPHTSMRADKLMRKAWPGPLTIVFDVSDQDMAKQRKRLGDEACGHLYGQHSIGIRCPDNPVATALLDACKRPVVAPSANLSGDRPATDAASVVSQFANQLDMVLDAGRCRFSQSSTVVKLGRGPLEVLRPGAYSERLLAELSTVQILMVCTGNTCRSPMAEGLFRKHLTEKLDCKVDRLAEFGYKVLSAGTLDMGGGMASSEAINACAALGVDLLGHRSRALTCELVADSDLIYVMSRAHRAAVLAIDPDAADKVLLLAGDAEVPDPIGQGQRVFDECAATIDRAVKERISELRI